MAGNEYADKARQRKVACFVKAAEHLAATQEDSLVFSGILIETLAGRFGPAMAGETWNGLRCLTSELSGINHGTPSVQTQTEVIGALYVKLCHDAHYASQTDEQVFAGLSVVS